MLAGSSIGLLKNGSREDLNRVTIKVTEERKRLFSLIHTCGFEVFTQIMFVAYADSQEIYKFMQENETSFFSLIISVLRHGIKSSTYKKRAEILIEIMLSSAVRYFEGPNGMECYELKAVTTIMHVVDSFFKDFPLYTEIADCSLCSKGEQRKQIAITLNFNGNYKLTTLNKIVQAFLDESVFCKRYGAAFTNRNRLGKIIFFGTCCMCGK